MNSPLVTRRLVERFYGDLWNRWDDEAVCSTLAADFDFRGSLGQRTISRDQWCGYRDMIRAGSANFHNEIVELICQGSRAAARLRYAGTHTGLLLDVPATNRRFVYAGAAFFVVERDLLKSAWVLGDLDALRRQLTDGGLE